MNHSDCGEQQHIITANTGPFAALRNGWKMMAAHYGMVVGASLLFVICFFFAFSFIPFISHNLFFLCGFILDFFLIPPLMGGYAHHRWC